MSVISGPWQAEAAKDAAEAQAEAAKYAADLQYKMFAEQKEMMEPWRKAGAEFALPKLQELITGGPPKYSVQDFMAEPYVGLALKEGTERMESSASARGMLGSGKAIKDISRGTADYITGAYPQRQEQGFSQWLRGEIAPLQSLAGLGKTAAGTTVQAGGAAAGRAGEAYMAAGEARASGYINQANAITGSMGPVRDIGSMWAMNKLGILDFLK